MLTIIGIFLGLLGISCMQDRNGVLKPVGLGIIGIAIMITPGGQPPNPQLLGLALLIIAIIWGRIYAQNEKNGTNERKRLAEQRQIEAERQEAIDSQYASEPWAIRYATDPCPNCGHYKVRNAKWEDKQLSIAFWGVASGKIGKHYKCEHCSEMW